MCESSRGFRGFKANSGLYVLHHSIFVSAPGSYQVGWSVLIPCAATVVSATPAPGITAFATAPENAVHTQSAEADATISYDYEVVCNACLPGAVVPLAVDGFTSSAAILGRRSGEMVRRLDVAGYDSVHNIDNANVVLAMASGNFCLYTSSPPEVRRACDIRRESDKPYPVIVSAAAGVINSLGFDSIGFSIAVSPGLGNSAQAIPEAAPSMLVGFAASGGISAHPKTTRRKFNRQS